MDRQRDPRRRLPLLLVALTGTMAVVLAAIEIESVTPFLGNISMLLAICLVPVGFAKTMSWLSRSAPPRGSDSTDPAPPA